MHKIINYYDYSDDDDYYFYYCSTVVLHIMVVTTVIVRSLDVDMSITIHSLMYGPEGNS